MDLGNVYLESYGAIAYSNLIKMFGFGNFRIRPQTVLMGNTFTKRVFV